MKKQVLLFITLLLLIGTSAVRAADAMYAVLNGSTLTFYYDSNKSSRSGTKYNMNSAGTAPSWAQKTNITTVEFDSSFKNARPTATTGWFWNLTGLTTIKGISNLNTSSVTNMMMMFYGCPLSSIDVSGFNTSNVTTMNSMFYGCSNLKTVNVSGFNTSKVTDMKSMFYNCTSLTSVDVTSFNTSKVTDLSFLFSFCYALTNLDISNFTLTSSQNTRQLLQNAGLKTLTIPATANVLDATACNGVGTTSAPCSLVYPSGFTPQKDKTGSGWYQWKSGYFKDGTAPTPTTTEAYAVYHSFILTFYYDDKKSSRSGNKYNLNTGANAPEWNSSTSNAIKVEFDSSFANAKPTSCYRWFYNMSKLTRITGIENLDTELVRNMESMFDGCSALQSIDVGNFDVSSVTTFAYMFNNCARVTHLNTEWWANSIATDMSYMFAGCSYLDELSFVFEESTVGGMPDYYSFLSTANVTKMDGMFSGCSDLKRLNLTGFSLSKKPSTTNFLKGCSSLEWLHVPENMGNLNASACAGVGTASNPCYMEFEGVSLDGVTKRTPTYFVWKGGYFRDFRFPGVSYDESTNTLSFWFSDYSGPPTSDIHDYDLNEGSTAPDWLEFASQVERVSFSESFKDACPTSCYQWFYNMTNLTAIEGLENLNTEYATNMASMFNGCKKLTSVDISKFTLTSSTNSKLMFNGCSGLKILTIPATAGYLASDACKGVGTASAPITLNYPSSFTPEKTSTGDGYFVWKSGYFKDTSTPTPTSGEMYAVLNGSTLTFYYDYNKSSRSGTKYSMNKAGTAPSWAQNANIKTVVFDGSFKNAQPTATSGWFWNLTGLTSITGISNLNTSSVTDMQLMFYGCPLSSIDVSGFDTGNVTTMNAMFYGCSNLETVDVSGFNTSKVSDMKSMFYNCTSLPSVDVTNFNTSKVTDLSFMFSFCYALTSLDISNFTLTSSQNTKQLLQNAGLKTLTIPATANVLDATACNGVGTTSAPCSLVFPSGFTPQKDKTGSGWYQWKSGYFKDGSPTGIVNPVADGLSKEGEWYNLQGQRVASPHHGIYIRNGKKYRVK